jgi:hypothetical protein
VRFGIVRAVSCPARVKMHVCAAIFSLWCARTQSQAALIGRLSKDVPSERPPGGGLGGPACEHLWMGLPARQITFAGQTCSRERFVTVSD